MRVETDKNNKKDEITEGASKALEEPLVSTQEFIEDARARKLLKTNESKTKFTCDKCDYNSGSITLHRRHVKQVHEDKIHPVTDNSSIRSENTPKFASSTTKRHDKKKYVPKRIKCENCEKQFNKKERFKTHMEKVHKVKTKEIISQAGSNREGLPNINLDLNLTLQKMTTRQAKHRKT